MTDREKRLVAALTVLRDGLGPVVEELLAGRLDAEGQALLANTLRTIADKLDPPATGQHQGDVSADVNGRAGRE